MVVVLFSSCGNKQAVNHNNNYTHAYLYYDDMIPWDICRFGRIIPNDFIRISKHQIFIPNNDTLHCLETRLDSLYAKVNKYNNPLPLIDSPFIDTYFAIVFHGNTITDTLAIGATHYSSMSFRKAVFRDSLLYFAVVDIIKHHDTKWERRFDDLYYPRWLDDSTLIMYNIDKKEKSSFIK